MNPHLELINADFTYPDGTPGLKDVHFQLHQGERVALLGENGAGKSTLFLVLNGIHRLSRGSLVFNNKKMDYKKGALCELRKNVGIVFQEPDHQLFSASVFEDIAFGPINLGLSRDAVKERVRETMKFLAIEELQDKPVHFLSYGQKKRAAIAGVVAMQPEVVLFDEPTAGLDPSQAMRLVGLLNMLHASGTAIMVSTHDMEFAYQWADRIVIMKNGTIVGDGTPAEIGGNKALLEHSGLIQPRVLRLYQQLQHEGLLGGGELPVTDDALIQLLKKEVKRIDN